MNEKEIIIETIFNGYNVKEIYSKGSIKSLYVELENRKTLEIRFSKDGLNQIDTLVHEKQGNNIKVYYDLIFTRNKMNYYGM